jgi:hypothetical protein
MRSMSIKIETTLLPPFERRSKSIRANTHLGARYFQYDPSISEAENHSRAALRYAEIHEWEGKVVLKAISEKGLTFSL